MNNERELGEESMSLSLKEDDQENIASNNDRSHAENVPTNLPYFDPLICRLSFHE